MVNYREIVRLKSLNYSNVSVANSCGSSRNTVVEVWKLAQNKNLGWPIPDALTNKDIEQLLFPERGMNEGRKLPDFEYIVIRHNKISSRNHAKRSVKTAK